MPYQRNNSNMIYPQETFQKQPDGVVFYKEGMLNDFPTANFGIFESWRYNFDSGKQVFRAISDDGNLGKLWEKRLVKDIYGNPQWTGWMEIPPAEAYGVQAIAVNDRPLQLPNADGAIKIQITPEIINTYTKKEIYDLIDKKISDNEDKVYTYVPWCIEQRDKTSNSFAGKEFLNGRIIADYGKWCTEAEDVLWNTYQNGGNTEQFYLVEPAPKPSKGGGVEVITPGETDNAKYFLWDQRSSPTGNSQATSYAWIPIDAPDMKAFVNYATFNEHQEDKQQHLNGEDERTKWNEASERAIKVETDLETKFDETMTHLTDHFNDVNTNDDNDNKLSSDAVLHVSLNDRIRWNKAFARNKEYQFPENNIGTRYVVKNQNYRKAFEQEGSGELVQDVVIELPSQSYLVDSTYSPNSNFTSKKLFEGMEQIIKDLATNGKDVTKIQVNLGMVSFAENKIWLETDRYVENDLSTKDHKSQELLHTSNATELLNWTILPPILTNESNNDPIYFDKIYLRTTEINRTVHIPAHNITVTYRQMNTANVGDPDKKLTLNLVGPEGVMPMYNGKPLTETVYPEKPIDVTWSNIEGEPKDNTKLMDEITRSKENMLYIPDNKTHLRYDIYQDTLIPSLIQQPTEEGKFETGESDFIPDIIPNLNQYYPGDIIFEGLKQKLFEEYRKLERIPYYCELQMGVDVSETAAMTAYLDTENADIERSAILQDCGEEEFTKYQRWPASSVNTPHGKQLTTEFDKIYLRGSPAILRNIKLHVKWIKYSDVTAEARDGRASAELHSWTQNAKNYNLNASGAININAEINTTWNPNGEPISGNLNIYTAQDFNTDVSGIVNESISGDYNTKISGSLNTDISGDVIIVYRSNEKINIEGSKEEAISGSILTTIKGDYTTFVGADITNAVSGSVSTKIDGQKTNLISGIDMNLVSGAITNVSETSIFETAPNINIKSQKLEFNKPSSEETHEYGAYIMRENEKIEIAKWNEDHKNDPDFVAKNIPSSIDSINVYGEELDNRYANRNLYETNISRIDGIITNEILDRQEEDEKLVDLIGETEIKLQDNIDIVSGSIKPEAIRIFNEKIVDYYKKDEVFTKDESDKRHYLKDEVYTKEETDNIQASEFERYDLVLNNNEEFNKTLNDGSFELSKRILFKNGDVYKYNKVPLEPIFTFDFTNIDYIKCEEPIHMIDMSEAQIRPLSYENTLLENTKIIIQQNGINYELNSLSNEIKTIEIREQEKAIVLDKYHTIYKFILFVDTRITLDNILTGRNYTFYIDNDPVSNTPFKMSFANHLHNALELNTPNGLEHLEIGKRTIIHATGINENDKNGLIINEVIPLVEDTKVGDIIIRIHKMNGQFYKPGSSYDPDSLTNLLDKWADNILVNGDSSRRSYEDKSLTLQEKEDLSFYGNYKEGEHVYILSTFTNGDISGDSELTGECTGWTHNYRINRNKWYNSDFYDWEIINPNAEQFKDDISNWKKYYIAHGRISMNRVKDGIDNPDVHFIMPSREFLGINENNNKPLELRFYAVAHRIPVTINPEVLKLGIIEDTANYYIGNSKDIILNPQYANDIDRYRFYQTYYDDFTLDIKVKDDQSANNGLGNGFFIYNLQDNLGEKRPNTYRWNYRIRELPRQNGDDRKVLFDMHLDNILQTVQITPYCYKKIYEIESIINDTIPDDRYRQDLIYFDDSVENKENRVHYILKDKDYLNYAFNNFVMCDPIMIPITTDLETTLKVESFDNKIIGKLNSHKITLLRDVHGSLGIWPHITFTTITGSGISQSYTKIITKQIKSMNLIQNFDEFANIPESIRERKEEIINNKIILRKSTSNPVKYTFEVIWDEITTQPTYRDGKWYIDDIDGEIGNSKAKIIKIFDMTPSLIPWGDVKWNYKVDIEIYEKGEFTLKFVSNYDNNFSCERKIRIYVHPEYGIIQVPVEKFYTDRNYNFYIKWYEKSVVGLSEPLKEISASMIDDTSGIWTSFVTKGNENQAYFDKENKDNENGKITISNYPIANGINDYPNLSTSDQFYVTFISNEFKFDNYTKSPVTQNGEKLQVFLKSDFLYAYRNSYKLSFNFKENDDTCLGVIFPNDIVYKIINDTQVRTDADYFFNDILLTFKQGYSMSDELRIFIENLPGGRINSKNGEDSGLIKDSYMYFSFYMPYEDTIISVSSKKI